MVLKQLTMQKIMILFFLFLLCTQSVSGQKNTVQLGVGMAGSDSFDPQFSYELIYKRKMSNIVSLIVQYGALSGEEDEGVLDLQAYTAAGLIDPKNQSDAPISRRSSMVSLSMGIQLDIVRHTGSKLFILSSVRYQQLAYSLTRGIGSNPEWLLVEFHDENTIGLEIGIGYERRFSKNHSLGGKLIIAPKTFLFGVSLTAGVYF